MRFIIAVLALALAACGQTTPQPRHDETPALGASAPGELSLAALTANDLATPLGGELGCSFVVGEEVLLVAKGNVDRNARSEALAKVNGAIVRFSATEAGGYDGMVEGAAFSTEALNVEVLTAARGDTGNEQAAYNATLTVRAGGVEQAYNGTWTCGP